MRDVGVGSHIVRVERDGFAAKEQRVSISPSRPSQSLTMALLRARAQAPVPPPKATGAAMTIDSRPSGASVRLDGKVIGTTPVMLGDVTAGEHSVSIELAGYRRWTTSVKVVAGERNRVAASLER
jgi:hypothetical protein